MRATATTAPSCSKASPFDGAASPNARPALQRKSDRWRERRSCNLDRATDQGRRDDLDEESLVAVSPHVPLLVLHGENDALIPVDIIADLAAQWTENATLSIEPGEDHWVLPSVARQKTFDFLLDHF